MCLRGVMCLFVSFILIKVSTGNPNKVDLPPLIGNPLKFWVGTRSKTTWDNFDATRSMKANRKSMVDYNDERRHQNINYGPVAGQNNAPNMYPNNQGALYDQQAMHAQQGGAGGEKISLLGPPMHPIANLGFKDTAAYIYQPRDIPEEDMPKTSPEPKPEKLLRPFSLRRQLEKLLSNSNLNITIRSIGHTAEYNEIVLIQASSEKFADMRYRAQDEKYANDNPDKKIIFITHGLSVAGVKEIPCLVKIKRFYNLLKFYFEHLDKFDIYIMPMANPDGLGYSYQNPLWNKNLSPQEACPGVALDRNFDVGWTKVANRPKSCSQQYPGTHPFSERETAAIRDVFHDNYHKMDAYIHVHATGYNGNIFKGDAVLYPRGFSDDRDDKYHDLRGELNEAMKNASFNVLSVGVTSLYKWYGQVAGTSVDYAATVYGVPYALEFVMQVYDTDPYAPNSEETASGAALSEVWHRIVDSVFKFIYRKTTLRATTENAFLAEYNFAK